MRAAAALLAFGMACDSTAPPPPVATVALSPASVDLVPGGTDVIVATPKDAAGNPLTDRPVTWTTSDASKVAVAAGVVTGVALGSATITATIEDKTASITVGVKDGATVLPTGGSFTAQSSAVSVVVPGGALTQTKNLTVAPAANPPVNDRLMPGTAFDFGPNALTFGAPVAVTIKYDPSKLTGGSPESGLQLYEVVGTVWRVVAGSTVNTTDHTVTGSVSHLSTFGVLMQPRVETVTINADMTVQVQTNVQFSATLKDNEQFTLTGRPIAWSSSDPTIVSIDGNGLAKTLLPGQATITATSEGKTGTSKVTVTPGPATNLAIVAGDAQLAATGTAVVTPPAVKVTDAFGNAIPGFAITFTVASGGGTVTGGAATTNASGVATVGSWTLGPATGPNTLTASGTGLNPASVTFTAAARLGPFKVVSNGGDGQTARINTAVAIPPSVRVTDAENNGVPNIPVTFAVTAGGGSIVGAQVVTNANGVASVTRWVVGTTAGTNTLTATAGSLQGSPITFTATATIPPPVAMSIAAGNQQTVTAPSEVPVKPAVRVTDDTGAGVPGVTVVFSIRSGSGSITGANAVTNSSGIATLGSWTLGVGGNSLFATVTGLAGSPLIFTATGLAAVQLVTFGDSNTEFGFSGANPTALFASYISNAQSNGTRVRLGPDDPNNPLQLAGKIEAKWKASRTQSIRVVNHGITGTTTGSSRDNIFGTPNALTVVNGFTRFQGEVLGMGYPWSGGEPTNDAYPNGSVLRVQAFQPRSSDFAYISLGTNDIGNGVSIATVLGNLETMVDQWIAQGLPASHVIITTLAPRPPGSSGNVPSFNDQLRAKFGAKGARVLSIDAFTSNDKGLTWKSSCTNGSMTTACHVGDSLHWAEVVRDWIADNVVSIMSQLTP
ncbi:MAG TPA: Ig-like domain-containing protein [Gemmatimonadaceae bacterium]|nr:Ig-like domain-containing protein [Gemmatimonadaceae bacterium]